MADLATRRAPTATFFALDADLFVFPTDGKLLFSGFETGAILKRKRMSGDINPTLVEEVKINTSAVVVDSAVRLGSDYPTRLNANLSGAIRGGKRVYHTSLMSTNGYYAHNRENMELKFTHAGDSDANVYSALLTPYYVQVSFDGNPVDEPDLIPVNGSYAADLEAALNFAYYQPDPSVKNWELTSFNDIFRVSYTKNTGLVIECDHEFEILQDSTWLQFAQATHGFGRRIASDTTTGYKFASPPRGMIAMADGVGNLSPIRYLGIVCDEFSEKRKLPSFSNVASPAFSSGEMNVFPVNFKNYGSYNELTTEGDSTVLNMDSSYGIQKVQVVMFGNNGQQLVCQDILPACSAAYNIVLRSEITRTNDQSLMLFSIWKSPMDKQIFFQDAAYLQLPAILTGVYCDTGEIVHKFIVQHPDKV